MAVLPHDNIVDNYPEINDWLGTSSHGAEAGSEGETEKYYSQRVGPWTVGELPLVLPGVRVTDLSGPRLGNILVSQQLLVINRFTYGLESSLE